MRSMNSNKNKLNKNNNKIAFFSQDKTYIHFHQCEKKSHGKILREKPKKQYLSTILKSYFFGQCQTQPICTRVKPFLFLLSSSKITRYTVCAQPSMVWTSGFFLFIERMCAERFEAQLIEFAFWSKLWL